MACKHSERDGDNMNCGSQKPFQQPSRLSRTHVHSSHTKRNSMSRRPFRWSVFAVVTVICVLLSGRAGAFFAETLVWEDQLIYAADQGAKDTFGSAVAISGDTMVVGSKGDDDNGKSESGSAYVFNRVSGAWVQGQKLHSPTPVKDGAFGVAVDIDGDTLVVGARAESGGIGNVYVFERTGGLGSWTFKRQFNGNLVTGGTPLAKFGATVAVEGDYIAIGSYLNKVWVFRRDAAGEGGWSNNQVVTLSGGGGFGAISIAMAGDLLVVGEKRTAAYIYSAAANFLQLEKITRAAVGGTADWFASSVATDGTTVVIGDLGADTVTPEINNHGAGYVYRQDTGGSWALVEKLLPDKVLSGQGTNLQVGFSAAVYGNTVALGSRAESSQ
ncbi:MAG: hypothetical protein PVJ49_17765, partial [Acidobacteriota bacterium]